MGVRHKVVLDRTQEINDSLNELKNREVEIGVFNGEHQWLAGIHEYGCRIPVTEKMRGWLAAHGLYLLKSTKFIIIPERSFLRSGFDKCHKQVNEDCDALIGALADGSIDADTVLDAYGTEFVSSIKNYAVNKRRPKNHPFTIKQKGSRNPLVDTGDMIESITYRKK